MGTNTLIYTGNIIAIICGNETNFKNQKKLFQQKLVRMLLMEQIMEFEFYMYIYLAGSLDHMYIKRTWLPQPQKGKDEHRFCNEKKKKKLICMYCYFQDFCIKGYT